MARGQTVKRERPSPGLVGESHSGGRNSQGGGLGGSRIMGDNIVAAASPPSTSALSTGSPITATSNSSAKRPGTSSLALKTRRYIDINISDVNNERARGKWTEEDDRMWKRTKPYECDLCGERGSTRYNIENRHKVNRHSKQKVIECPDCKLMFTRKDNLIKHQKKAHPEKIQTPPGETPPPKTRQRRNAEPKAAAANSKSTNVGPAGGTYGVEELAGDFRFLPVAEDLPSKHMQGLMALNNPEKLPFLPPRLLTHYADYYFQPNHFHPHLPLIHRPTFNPSSVLASFLRAVCCVGNVYDTHDKTMGPELWESGWKVMERWIERGTENEDLTEGSFAQLMKNDGNGVAQGGRADTKWARESRLCVLQGMVLFEFYGLFSDNKERERKARTLHFRCTEIAREHGYLEEMKMPPNYAELPLQKQWELFIECESRKRTAYSLYILDCNLSLLFNTPRLLRLQELKKLSLPCDDELFEAQTAEEWDRVRHAKDRSGCISFHDGSGVYINSGGFKILFGEIYKKLMLGGDRVEKTYLGKETKLNDYASYLMVIGVIMEILALTQRVAEEEEEPDRITGRGGKTVVIFNRDKSAEIERLRKALATVGKLPRFGHILDQEKKYPYEILRCSLGNTGEIFEDQVREAAPLPQRLQGCAKAFYMAWHLAHIMLVIPDRMCLRNEETPLDMHTSFSHILVETMARLEKVTRASSPSMSGGNDSDGMGGVNPTTAWGLGEGQMIFSTVFEKQVTPHLFAVLRFTVSSKGHPMEIWDSEFPTVLAMVFKALVVVWELIVRVYKEEEERKALTQPIAPPLLGPFTQATANQQVDPFGSAWNLNQNAEWIWNHSGGFNDGGYFPWNPHTTLHPQYAPPQMPEQPEIKLNSAAFQQIHHQLMQQRRTRSPGENFLQEILSFVKFHEMLQEDVLDGGETTLLEPRYLRWMKGVFDEITGWDVGRAVVKVMDQDLRPDDEKF